MMARCLALALVFTVWATGLSAQLVIEDEDYRFRLRHSGDGWRLLREEAARGMVPDATAGAAAGGGRVGVIIFERSPQADLQAYADLLRSGLPSPSVEVLRSEPSELFGRAAWTMELLVEFEGVPFRYSYRLVQHQDYLMQIVGWILRGGDGPPFEEFVRAIELLDGEVVGRSSARPVLDDRGIGWRVEDGVYESALSGLRLHSTAEWQVLAGGGLRLIDPGADVGLECNSDEIYLLVVSERGVPAEESERRELARSYRDALAATVTGRTKSVEFLGEPLVLHEMILPGSPRIVFQHGTVHRAGRATQIMGWWLGGLENGLEKVIEGLGQFETLSTEEQSGLREELLQHPHPQVQVGSGFALRNGVYRNFAGQFEWASPAGFWNITTGDDLHALNPVACLHAEDKETGLFCLLIPEVGLGLDPREFHEVVVTQMGLSEVGVTRPVEIDGAPFLVTSGLDDLSFGESSIDFDYRIATTIVGPLALQVLVWGRPEDIAANPRQVDAALAGLRFRALSEVDAGPGRWVDHRMGFQLDLGEDDRELKDETPAEIGSLGRFALWERGPDAIGITAIHAPGAGQDPRAQISIVERLLAQHLSGGLGERRESESSLAGRPALRISVVRAGTHFEARLMNHRGTVYIMFVTGLGGPNAAQPVFDGFSLLD